jgi:ABC-type xylose transport system permease subunit
MVFFAFHYGMFWVVHGLFVFALFGGSGNPFSETGDPFTGQLPAWWTLAAVSLLLSHGVSFVTNFLGKREYLAVSSQQQMGEPYSRVVVLHVTILGGGFLIEILGTPVAALVLLVVLKTAIDLRAHLKEHRKAERRLEEAPANDWSAWTETRR